MKNILRIILITCLCFMFMGAGKCNKKKSNANSPSNANVKPTPEKTIEERVADFKHKAAQYRHRIQNGLLRLVEFKRELKRDKKLSAEQDLSLNETISKINERVNAVGGLIERVDISRISLAITSLDETSVMLDELDSSLRLFFPKDISNAIQAVTEGVKIALSGLRLLLVTTEQEISNG